jgi:triosephosphate isomerase
VKPVIVAGNWKCNLDKNQVEDFLRWTETLSLPVPLEVWLFASSCFLGFGGSLHTKNLSLGAQDVSTCVRGAFTGEVAAFQLKSLGIQRVLVGHSERRTIFGETDQVLSNKLDRLTEQGLTACYCFGETLNQRKQGQTLKVIENQLTCFVRKWEGLNPQEERVLRSAWLAYEPVWAIGTGETAKPHDIEEVHKFTEHFIRFRLGLDLPILYGGSIKAENSYDTLKTPGVSGLLVGGASNRPESFGPIIEAAKKVA